MPFSLSTELVKVIKLEEQKTVTTNWYTTKCLPEIFKEVIWGMLHDDSASSHVARLAVKFLEEKQVKVIPIYPMIYLSYVILLASF